MHMPRTHVYQVGSELVTHLRQMYGAQNVIATDVRPNSNPDPNPNPILTHSVNLRPNPYAKPNPNPTLRCARPAPK